MKILIFLIILTTSTANASTLNGHNFMLGFSYIPAPGYELGESFFHGRKLSDKIDVNGYEHGFSLNFEQYNLTEVDKNFLLYMGVGGELTLVPPEHEYISNAKINHYLVFFNTGALFKEMGLIYVGTGLGKTAQKKHKNNDNISEELGWMLQGGFKIFYKTFFAGMKYRLLNSPIVIRNFETPSEADSSKIEHGKLEADLFMSSIFIDIGVNF